MLSAIGFNELWGVDLISWFPSVIGFWVPLPFDKVLKSSSPSGVSMVDDFLHFVFFFTFDKVRWWPRVVWSVCVGFAIGR